jgi:hypothetical protein
MSLSAEGNWANAGAAGAIGPGEAANATGPPRQPAAAKATEQMQSDLTNALMDKALRRAPDEGRSKDQ